MARRVHRIREAEEADNRPDHGLVASLCRLGVKYLAGHLAVPDDPILFHFHGRAISHCCQQIYQDLHPDADDH